MSDFVQKSKDLCFEEEPGKHEEFKEVFKEVERLSRILNIASLNLGNIEEVLSLLEMGAFASGATFAESYKTYLCDVVNHYTPSMLPQEQATGKWDTEWPNRCFGSSPLHN